MLLRAQRQSLHATVARCYEESYRDIVDAKPELLAYHFREANNPTKSVEYLLIAAEQALLHSANREALVHLDKARELLRPLPEAVDRQELELKLEVTWARAMLAMRGYTAPETREAYRRARERCEKIGNQVWLPLIIHGQWVVSWMAADHAAALDEARRLHTWGHRFHDPVGLAVGHTDIGITLATLGRLREAHWHLDQALRINKFVLPGRQPFIASDADGRISALSFMHNCLLLLGFPDQAEGVTKEVTALQPKNLYSRSLAGMRVLRMHVFARDAGATAETGLELLRLVEAQGFPYLIGAVGAFTGWALAQCGDTAAGLAMCEQGVARLEKMSARCWLPLFLALLAECHEKAGNWELSAAAAIRATEHVEASGERIWEPEIYRLEGRLLLSKGDHDGAEARFLKAIDTASQQEAKLLTLRAAVSFSRLLMQRNRSNEARDALAPIYGTFTEGFNFIDLREARTLLAAPQPEGHRPRGS
jgi:predicted ATPase